jgi:triphosphoribosyl-dephospho-CoA synthase
MESRVFTSAQLAIAYRAACMGELQALKPGNVHAFADGHGMTIQDFILSADVTAEMMTRADLTVGERIFYAAEATKKSCRPEHQPGGAAAVCADYRGSTAFNR